MSNGEDKIEQPATWENKVAGEFNKVVGKIFHKDDLVEAGEAQIEVAEEVDEEYDEEHEHDHDAPTD